MSGIVRIEIQFPTPVELPDGFEQMLDSLTDMVCKKWERENPTMIMWTAGHGSKMLMHPGMVDDDHPMEFDDSVYAIEVDAREDYSGTNPHNPQREQLREEAAKARGPGAIHRRVEAFAKVADVQDLMQLLPKTRDVYTREDVAAMLAGHQFTMNTAFEQMTGASREEFKKT